MTMKVRKPAYSDVTELNSRLYVSKNRQYIMNLISFSYDFKRNIPFYIRCRAAFLSMPSRYPQYKMAVEASPEPSRRSLTVSFQVSLDSICQRGHDSNLRQQMNLALNISETIINLHRPYYAKALYEDVQEGIMSPCTPSFLAVVERCSVS